MRRSILRSQGRASAYGSDCAVTRTVQDLEDAHWTPILDRQARPLQPALAGTETYEFARPALSSIGDRNADIMHDGGPAGGFRRDVLVAR